MSRGVLRVSGARRCEDRDGAGHEPAVVGGEAAADHRRAESLPGQSVPGVVATHTILTSRSNDGCVCRHVCNEIVVDKTQNGVQRWRRLVTLKKLALCAAMTDWSM